MTEVILNDECMHCETKECHDGYNFCNQAMKKNSFYKNAKLYKGLEVIQSPTYEELEKEAEGKYIKKSKRLTHMWNGAVYQEGYKDGAEPREKQIDELKAQIKVLEQNLEDTEICENGLKNRIADLEAQIEKMKAELHHRLVSPSHDDSDCLDKIIGLDRLWQFGQEF